VARVARVASVEMVAPEESGGSVGQHRVTSVEVGTGGLGEKAGVAVMVGAVVEGSA